MKNKILEVVIAILKKLLPTEWIKWLDGYKSIIGIIGFSVCVILPHFGVVFNADVMNTLQTLFGALGIYGFADKLEKAKQSTNDLKDVLESIKTEQPK